MKNAQVLAGALLEKGLKLVGGGTSNHLLIIDYSQNMPGLGGVVSFALDCAGIYANKNTVPGEPGSPFYPSGIRIGTPLVTTRGMKEAEMKQIAAWIARVSEIVGREKLPAEKAARGVFIKACREKYQTDEELAAIAKEVKDLTSGFPLFAG